MSIYINLNSPIFIASARLLEAGNVELFYLGKN